jgi:tetratricopeptide (TPR) repeat protein/predicted small lipoprotein YifL
VTIRALSALMAALAVAGCATTGPRTFPDKAHGAVAADQPKDFGTGGALLDHAVFLIAAASPSSLVEGIRLASAADALGAGGAAGAGILGDALLRALYPSLHLSRGGTGLAWSATRITSPFLSRIGPALPLLDPDAAVDDPTLRTRLAEAGAMLPSSPLPPYFLALLAGRGTGAFREEHAQLDEALNRSPGFVPAAVELSRVIIDGGTAPSELPLLRHLASLLPTPTERFTALARAGIAAGQPAEAADAAAQGLVQAPDDTGLVLLRAQALAAEGDWYRSLSVLDAMLRRRPDFAPAILLKARLLHESAGNDPEALGMLADAQARFPSNVSFLELQSRILLDENKTADAVAVLKHAHDIDPRSISVLSALVATSVDARNWNEAAAYFSQIPKQLLGPAQLRLGWKIATALGDNDLALYFAQELVKAAPAVDAIALEARSMLAAGRHAEAMVAVDHALLAMSPAPVQASDLHYIRSQAGSPDALQDLRTALRENPDNAEALAAIADVLAGQKNYRKAAEYARRAAALVPGDPALARKAEDLQKLVPAGQTQ